MQPMKMTALYERISREDRNEGESFSILQQKDYLETYAAANGFENCRHYTDDGFSGRNFERPGWQQMMTDIDGGKIGTVLVKDMSRVGRDYLQTGFYTEIYFKEKDVRFIAIDSHVDNSRSDSLEFSPIAAYLDMRKDGRETWNRYAQEKGAVHDLKDGFKAVSFLSNHELYTVGQLGQYIDETKQVFSKIKAESAAKERRICDIDALFGAIQTIRELKPIQQEYESIHWSGKREKFKVEHGDELNRLQKAIWLREKLVKSLGLASPLDKEQRAALKTERAQLEAEREALLPKLEEVRAELAELNRIRYWTRKVIPDALPRMSDGRVSVEDAMETAGNRKELEEIMEKTEQRVTRQQSEHEKNQKNQSPKDKLI